MFASPVGFVNYTCSVTSESFHTSVCFPLGNTLLPKLFQHSFLNLREFYTLRDTLNIL